MGSLVYDFLNESLLFDQTLIASDFHGVTEARLSRELAAYREYILSHLDDLAEEIGMQQQHLRLFGDRDHFNSERLRQAALYLHQIVLPDPMFPFSRTTSKVEDTMVEFLGMPGNTAIDRNQLATRARTMREYRPMIAANFLKYYPTSYYSEPSNPMTVKFSPDGYASALPEHLLTYYRQNAQPRSMRKRHSGWAVDTNLKLGRGLAIGFRGDNRDELFIYNLYQQKLVKADDGSKIAYLEMSLPEDPPSLDEWERWVEQSINRSALTHFERISKDIGLCSRLNASYITGSSFTNALLGQSAGRTNIHSHTANCVLNLDLPFLENISTEDLMSVRDNDGEAFALFRLELERRFRELRNESNSDALRVKAENIVHELKEIQLRKVDEKIRELKKGALAEAAIALGGLAASVVTSGLSLAATLVALANGYHTYSEFREKVRENPAYFLWKAKKA